VRITRKKGGIYIHLENKYPDTQELAILNAKNSGTYWVDESRGYKRVLCSAGVGHTYNGMECPINETFRM
tara:strand:- start:192 stop:401 length:210 start_codon:yes stop_codon:yes gene_type:complete